MNLSQFACSYLQSFRRLITETQSAESFCGRHKTCQNVFRCRHFILPRESVQRTLKSCKFNEQITSHLPSASLHAGQCAKWSVWTTSSKGWHRLAIIMMSCFVYGKTYESCIHDLVNTILNLFHFREMRRSLHSEYK